LFGHQKGNQMLATLQIGTDSGNATDCFETSQDANQEGAAVESGCRVARACRLSEQRSGVIVTALGSVKHLFVIQWPLGMSCFEPTF
jgi:hypothetical protein